MGISDFADKFKESMEKLIEKRNKALEGKENKEEENQKELLEEISQKLDLLLKKFEKST